VGLLFIAIRIASSIYRTYKPRQEEKSSSEEAEIQAAFVQEEIKAGDQGVVELPARPMNWGYSLIMMLMLFASVRVLGFGLSSFLFLAIAPLIMGYRKLRVIFMVSATMTIALVGILTWFFKIPLPEGLLIKVIRGY
jgi:hypothetical protein